MRATGTIALLAGVCGAAVLATTVELAGQGREAGQPGVAPAVQGDQGRGARGGGRAGGRGGGRGAGQAQAPQVLDVQQMLAALPDSAPARACHQLPVNDPGRVGMANCAPDRQNARRVLVLGRAAGFVHSSIPLAARTVEALGMKTGAWQTVITFNAADINAANLANYDAVFLASTTGAFLDDPNAANDPAVQATNEARRKALMDFVRGGKGLAGVHASTDSYHGGGRGSWPEFNHMVGGFFKWHWNYPTLIALKIEDLNNPINASFTTVNAQTGARQARNVSVADEVYTFEQSSWSRERVHVLMSIDYAKMPQEIKNQEPANGRRTDGDYGLSYIRREGNGRVYVNVLGHHESIYKDRALLEHTLAGLQYALGDLKGVDDSPTVKR